MVAFLRDFAASCENHAFPDIEKSDEPSFREIPGGENENEERERFLTE
jgi:hypothetical protein